MSDGLKEAALSKQAQENNERRDIGENRGEDIDEGEKGK